MNKLSIEKQAQIIRIHCEGNSLRSTARITGNSINTVVKLIKDVGAACLDYQDRVMRNLTCKKLQVDEIWSLFIPKTRMYLKINRVNLAMVISGRLPLSMLKPN